ncbi:hypothetical protein ES708_04180 [subsurface metagenome]
MRAIYEESKLDVGLIQALDGGDVTSRYFSAGNCGRLLALLECGAMAATKTIKIELLQAKDADGSESKGIPSTAEQAAKAEIAANEKIAEGTVDLTTVADTDIVTVNDIDFTKAATTTEADREFADAAGLVNCIGDDTYGVPGAKASYSGAVVTLWSEDPGEAVVTLEKTEVAGTITLATAKAQAFVELDVSKLDLAGGFNHVAIKVTTTATTTIAAVMVRGHLRYSPIQKVGASKVY